MQKSYLMLKSSLRQAAKGSGAILEDLIELPDDPESIITMLTNALERVKVNDGTDLV